MKKIIFLLSALLAGNQVHAGVYGTLTDLVEGVKDAKPHKHVVFITDAKSGEFCTGVALNAQTVLTCAHTLVGKDASGLKVVTSDQGSSNAGRKFAVRDIIFHPDFRCEKTGKVDTDLFALLETHIHDPAYMLAQTQTVVSGQRCNMYGPDIAVVKVSTNMTTIPHFPSVFNGDTEGLSLPLSLSISSFGYAHTANQPNTNFNTAGLRRHCGTIGGIEYMGSETLDHGVLYQRYMSIGGEPRLIQEETTQWACVGGDSGAPLFTDNGQVIALVSGAKHVNFWGVRAMLASGKGNKASAKAADFLEEHFNKIPVYQKFTLLDPRVREFVDTHL